MECKVIEKITELLDRFIRIYPEWNVKYSTSSGVGIAFPIRIYPEWNVKLPGLQYKL